MTRDAVTRRVLPVAVVAGAVLGGCGQDTLNATDYRARLDQLCGQLAGTRQGLLKQRAGGLSAADFDKRLAKASRDTFDEIKAVKPPAELKDGHEVIVGLIGGDAIDRLGPPDQDPDAKTAALVPAFRDVGAKACARYVRSVVG